MLRSPSSRANPEQQRVTDRPLRRRIATVLLAGGLAVASLTGCGEGGGGPQPPAHGAYIGAAVKPSSYTETGRIEAFQNFERSTGRALDIVHTYHPWTQAFPTKAERHFLEAGQQVLIGWAGSDCPGIAAGRYDSLIRRRAEAVKRLDTPVFIAFRWEMDRPNLRGKVGSPADYIAAWKHTRQIFDDVGATNVGWVWAPTAKGFTGGYAQAYYPGDDQVDWLGVDAYTGPRLRPFSQVMAAFMRFAAKHDDKPAMVAEFGLSDRGGKRPGWLAAARTYVKAHPQLKAVLYFNWNTEPRDNAQLALQASATGRRAFHAWLADPYFNTDDRTVRRPR